MAGWFRRGEAPGGQVRQARPARSDQRPVIVPQQRRIGLLVNPGSHANRGGRNRLDAVLARHPEIAATAPTADALMDTLRSFARAGIDLVVVSGGDGTLRDVLSALPHAYGGALPDLAILAAGNTNLAARALGSPGHGSHALERLLSAAARGRLRRSRCPVLEVSWPGDPERLPVRGLFFGAAGFTEGKRLADRAVHERGFHRGLAVGLAVAATVLRALAGSGTLLRGMPMQVGVDGGNPAPGPRFMVLATTLDRLMLGLWPFWGDGDGPLRWLDVTAPPQRLAVALPAILLRRPRRWMTQAGYRSGQSSHMRVRLARPFMLDGEAFDPGSDGILLSVPESVTFVTT